MKVPLERQVTRVRRRARHVLSFATLAAAGLVAPSAGAFCRTTTVAIAPDFQPRPDKCWDQGLPLYWKNICVGYNIQRQASHQVTYEQAAEGISKAFARWTSAACATDGHGRSRVSVDVRDLGPVDCAEVQYNPSGPNQNVIVFRDDVWTHQDTSNALALTTVNFNPDSGEIYNADMEINTAPPQTVAPTDPVPADGFDFASIVTHEAGHFLGLAHSGDPHATMFASYTPGATVMRYLTNDDVTGICTIYRPDGDRSSSTGRVSAIPSCDPTPRRGFTGSCADTPSSTSCIRLQIAAPRTTSTPGWLLAASLAALLGARRRARKPASRT